MKEQQCEEYKKMIEKYTDKKLLQELKSYRKHFQSHAQFYDWTYLNPEDFSNNDGLRADDRSTGTNRDC